MDRHYKSRSAPRDRHLTHERVHINIPNAGLRVAVNASPDLEGFKRNFRAVLERGGVAFDGDDPVSPWHGVITHGEIVFTGWRARQ